MKTYDPEFPFDMNDDGDGGECGGDAAAATTAAPRRGYGGAVGWPDDHSSASLTTEDGDVTTTLGKFCFPAGGTFSGVSSTGSWDGADQQFETCY